MEVFEIVMQMERREGEMYGRKKVSIERDTLFVENLLRLTDCTDDKIASLTGVSLSFIAEVKTKLRSN